MTSELKPFLNDMLSMSIGTDGRTSQIHFSRPVTLGDRLAITGAHNAAVTRAAPEVPELVTVAHLQFDDNVNSLSTWKTCPVSNNGAFPVVRHDQAAAVIASWKHVAEKSIEGEIKSLDKLRAAEANNADLRALALGISQYTDPDFIPREVFHRFRAALNPSEPRP